ncbi:MAG: AAA domain-containing protein [Candidatus Entotheonellia bacterium]
MGLAEAMRWREALRDLLEHPAGNPRRVVEAFAHLAMPREFSLSSLPNKDFRVAGGTREIVCAAVFFHAEFAGQGISEDLRQLQGRPPEGTALEAALRVNNELPPDHDLPEVSEQGRFFTAESDPSQEAAVLKARQWPGLVIEGPPGTGKSQTIVNMVGDCIGRRETVLIVCQKLPALQVVAKRLQAEGLSDRFFMITDVNKERQPIVQALKQQLQNVFTENNDFLQATRKQREDLAARIEIVQREIDEHHQALHQSDEETGLSYRTLIGELLAIEASGPFADTPALRGLLGTVDRRQLSAIEEACSPLSPLWLAAHYENSALAILKPFSSDAALIEDFTRGFRKFLESEEARDQVNRQTPQAFDVDDTGPHRAWLDEHTRLFRTMDPATRQNLAKWFDVFNATGTETSRGQEAIDALEALEERLGELNLSHHDADLFSVLAELPVTTLRQWLVLAQKACTPSSFLSWLNPVRLSNRRKLRKILA